LEDVKDLQLVSGTLNLDENHDPIKSATILEYVDGKQTFKTKINP
jgi:branched-chain amino acid transport system substrate-binding protein